MSRGRILIVDDEREVGLVLAAVLRREGYETATAITGEAAIREAESRPPSLIVLDVMLPDIDGFELLRRLRRRSEVPVIFLSGMDTEADRISGLRLGADDYIIKPFSPQELAARVAAVLHRTGPASEGTGETVRFGTAEADLGRRELRVAGHARDLTPKEFDLLACLIKVRGKALSRDEILEKVWGYEKGLDLSTRTVDQHVARLRRKLRGERHRIVTVSKNGYRIVLDERT
ncbi:MAG: response regulator transcription factor [Elusimicrobia bacterium]|nr:response regulator transcription factor [Elusimicrobiota bacterium]